MWILFLEHLYGNIQQQNDLSCIHTTTYPQCLPITSRIKALWWLQRQINVLSGWKFNYVVPHVHRCVCMHLPLSCCCDGIHYFYDSVQSWIRANGHVCATEIIVYGSNHPNDVQMRWTFSLLCCDLTYSMRTDRQACVLCVSS